MKKFIDKCDREDKDEIINKFNELTGAEKKKDKKRDEVNHIEVASYLDVKKWFLKTFPEIEKFKENQKKKIEEIKNECGKDDENLCDANIETINEPVNVKAVYYMPTRRKVDLCNLHEALCDVLVHYGIVADDNSNIIATMDGSCVKYDKNHPRTEVTIERIGEENGQSN